MHVKAELKLPALKVIYNPVTSANRIPLIANGTIELECGSTVNNVERQAQVAFSDTTFIVSTRFIAKRDGNLKTLADLRGKTVVCTAGTNTLARVNGLNQKQNLGMTILTGKDHAESLLMVDSGRAAAFFEDDILLTGLAANSRDPASWSIGAEGLQHRSLCTDAAARRCRVQGTGRSCARRVFQERCDHGDLRQMVCEADPAPWGDAEFSAVGTATQGVRDSDRFARSGQLRMTTRPDCRSGVTIRAE